MKIKLSIATVCLLLLAGCKLRSREYRIAEKLKIETCRQNWAYQNLPQGLEVKVLLFQAKSQYHLMSYPNFIIGVTATNDTIGIIDKDFEETLKHGTTCNIKPATWNTEDKELLKPVYAVYASRRMNALYCSAHVIYYGKIE